MDDDDADLTFTVEYALSKQNQPLRKSRDETQEAIRSRRHRIARAIVAHLKLSNWRFQKGRVSRGHSTAGVKRRDG